MGEHHLRDDDGDGDGEDVDGGYEYGGRYEDRYEDDLDEVPAGGLRLGREPALVLGVVAVAAQLAAALLLPITVVGQGLLGMTIAVVAAAVLAAFVVAEQAVAVLVGMLQAGVAAGLAFGFGLPVGEQAAVMVVVGAAASCYARTQLEVRVGPGGEDPL